MVRSSSTVSEIQQVQATIGKEYVCTVNEAGKPSRAGANTSVLPIVNTAPRQKQREPHSAKQHLTVGSVSLCLA